MSRKTWVRERVSEGRGPDSTAMNLEDNEILTSKNDLWGLHQITLPIEDYNSRPQQHCIFVLCPIARRVR